MQIEIRSTVTLNLTADDWQLYDREGREQAALNLNLELAEMINNTTKRSEVNYWDILGKHSEFGAADSEGFATVEFILDKVYRS